MPRRELVGRRMPGYCITNLPEGRLWTSLAIHWAIHLGHSLVHSRGWPLGRPVGWTAVFRCRNYSSPCALAGVHLPPLYACRNLYNWGSPTAANRRHDVVEEVRVFFDSLGARLISLLEC